MLLDGGMLSNGFKQLSAVEWWNGVEESNASE
jgi:hypothetical protein